MPAPSTREPLAKRTSLRFCQRPHLRGGCLRSRLGESSLEDNAAMRASSCSKATNALYYKHNNCTGFPVRSEGYYHESDSQAGYQGDWQEGRDPRGCLLYTSDGAQSIVENALDRCVDEQVRDWNSVKTRVREALSSYIYRRTKRSPMILPILMEV